MPSRNYAVLAICAERLVRGVGRGCLKKCSTGLAKKRGSEVRAEDVRKGIELCDRIIAELDRLKAENEQTLRESRRRMEPIRAELRRAGYLR